MRSLVTPPVILTKLGVFFDILTTIRGLVNQRFVEQDCLATLYLIHCNSLRCYQRSSLRGFAQAPIQNQSLLQRGRIAPLGQAQVVHQLQPEHLLPLPDPVVSPPALLV